MFRIPNYFQMNMAWDDAVRTIKGRGNGDLLAGMEEMNPGRPPGYTSGCTVSERNYRYSSAFAQFFRSMNLD